MASRRTSVAAEWIDSALYTLNQLGFKEHQYVLVAHEDKKHFHIHVMVNRVHPETYKAHTPYRDWITLDAAARSLEAKYGWSHTPGTMRWDEDRKMAVPASKVERIATRSAQQHPRAPRHSMNIITMRVSAILHTSRSCSACTNAATRQSASWEALHTLLAKSHLRLEKGEASGYPHRPTGRRSVFVLMQPVVSSRIETCGVDKVVADELERIAVELVVPDW